MTDASITSSSYSTYNQPEFDDYFELLKPRVMSLVIFTASVGLFVAPNGVHPILAFASILFIAIGAGASGALKMWWDADIDSVMKRTSERPIPGGRVSPSEARNLGLWLSVFSVGMLAITANFLSAALLAFTIFFYAVVYTMWLKRWTPQNIVIGGAAGAFPPMIGWVAATGGVSVESVLMFALIFMWTPPHFWALALFMNDDYSKAGVPMLTVTHGKKSTRLHILIYSVLLAPLAMSLAFTEIGGPIYFLTALGLNGWFLLGAYRMFNSSEINAALQKYSREKTFFFFSIFYLFAHFMALLIEAFVDFKVINWPVLF